MQNAMMVLFWTGNTVFGKIYSREPKLLVYAEIWFLDYFKYGEFNVALHDFGFDWKLPFSANYFQAIRIISLKFGPKTSSNIQLSMMVFSFCIFDRKYTFGSNLIKKKTKLLV